MEITDNQILTHDVISSIEDRAIKVNDFMTVKDVLDLCKEVRKQFNVDGLTNDDIEDEQKMEDVSPYN